MRRRVRSPSPAWLPDFAPPPALRVSGFRLVPLHPDHAEADYRAFRSCAARLRAELDWNGWPRPDFTLEDNIADLAEHFAEFEAREAYAYSVFAASDCVGCVYIEPWSGGAQLAYWLVDGSLPREGELVAEVLDWLQSWPFEQVVLPLRPQNARSRRVLSALGLTRGAGPDGFESWVRPVL